MQSCFSIRSVPDDIDLSSDCLALQSIRLMVCSSPSSQTPDYKSEDINSMHTGCPVVEGVKWNAVKWIHGIPFRGDDYKKSFGKFHPPQPDPGFCTDRHEMCEQWAKAGECKNNPGYMKGGDGDGQCRLACKDCKVCRDAQDVQCIEANRASGGFINFNAAEEFGDLWEGAHGLEAS